MVTCRLGAIVFRRCRIRCLGNYDRVGAVEIGRIPVPKIWVRTFAPVASYPFRLGLSGLQIRLGDVFPIPNLYRAPSAGKFRRR